jgi:hypothetical protein
MLLSSDVACGLVVLQMDLIAGSVPLKRFHYLG